MSQNFEKLFEPGMIGNLKVKNRFIYAPMGIANDPMTGCIAEKGIAYFEARAKGGVGMVNIGFQNVSNKLDPLMMHATGIGTSVQEEGWAKLCERMHKYGTAVMIQLSCGLGRNAPVIPGQKNVSASVNANFCDPTSNARELTTEEVKAIPKAYAVAAAACKRAGVDSIEIHGHVGYLLDQFMTPLWNRRTDEYGSQSFENRMRLATEIYKAIRSEVGPDYPIAFRMVIEHTIPGGRTKEESAEIIRYLDNLGVDAFDVDRGCYEAYDWVFPTAYMGDGCMTDVGAYAKAITNKPVFTVGSYTPKTAEKAVEEGKTDFVVIGRGMLADPEFVNKVQEGRLEDIRPCLKCNRYCLSSSGIANAPVTCSVNRQMLFETELPLEKKAISRKVAIIGGGVAGMEAARVAATIGHTVTLYEKNSKLGGQLIPAAGPSFKNRIKALNEYYKVQLKKLNVSVVLNREITVDAPELRDADQIIVAVGARPSVPPIPGVNGKNVLEVTDLHTGDPARIGSKVIVAGGGPSGCDCAIQLAMEGKLVTLVEMQQEIYPTATLDNKLSVLRKIGQEKVTVLTGTKIKEILPDGVQVLTAEGEKKLEADTVVLALGMKANSEEAKHFQAKYPNAVIIGDCNKVGQIGEAVHAGFMAAYNIN